MANLIRELRAQLGTTPVNDPCAVLIVPWDHSSLVESGNRTGTDTALLCQVHAGEGHYRGTALWTSVSVQLGMQWTHHASSV